MARWIVAVLMAAAVNGQVVRWPDRVIAPGSTQMLNNTTVRVCNVVTVRRSGSIVAVHLPTAYTNWGGNSVEVRIETVATNGTPSGILWGSGTSVTLPTPPSANAYYRAQLQSPAVVARGDLIAVVVRWASTAGTEYSFRSAVLDQVNIRGGQYATSWSMFSAGSSGAALVLEMSDGEAAAEVLLGGWSTWKTYNSSSNPDEWGTAFSVQWPSLACAIAASMTMGTAGTVTVRLYDVTSGEQVLAERTITRSQYYDYGSVARRFPIPPTPLVPGRSYIVSVRPDTNNVTLYGLLYSDAVMRMIGFTSVKQSSRVNDEAWTYVGPTGSADVIPAVLPSLCGTVQAQGGFVVTQ